MKKIVFLTGTRADFGKLKSLMLICDKSTEFEVDIFVTGMHNIEEYGSTYIEILESGFTNIYRYNNHENTSHMDIVLAQTIIGFSEYVKKFKPDLLVVHGDRVEPLAGAIVGSLNNILVAHIEGGEISGTIDELIRHAVSKMSHIHFVSNKLAKKRLIQMGEFSNNIHIIGSPDVDIMKSKNLPDLEIVKNHYKIEFQEYSIVMFHPVTTEFEMMKKISKNFVDAILKFKQNYIVIFPNNDLGSDYIIDEYRRLENKNNIKIFPSIRFEYFLTLLKNAKLIIGNSSAGIREAPYYGLPVINIGTRQQNRYTNKEVINCNYETKNILNSLKKAVNLKYSKRNLFGEGNSDKLFIRKLKEKSFWLTRKQKIFNDI